MKLMKLLTITISFLSIIAGLTSAAEITSGVTQVFSVGVQDVELLPGTPFNPGTESVAISDLTASGYYTLDRASQSGTTIDVVSGNTIFTGNHPILGDFQLGSGPAFGIGTYNGSITQIVQNSADPGFTSGDPSSFQSGVLTTNATFGLKLLSGPAAGAQLFTKSPATFTGTIDGLPPAPGTAILSQDPIEIFTTDPSSGSDVLVAISTNRRIQTIPEPSSGNLVILGLVGMVTGRRSRRPTANTDILPMNCH